ncbi:MAG: RAMP superfamily CRISPR-associated protein [Succinivibrio sp.]
MQKRIVIKFLSEWQVSSGVGDGYLADNKISRDSKGYPFIPGRAVKGALREGANLIANCNGRSDLKRINEIIFGTGSREDKANLPGLIRVSEARLNEDLTCYLDNLEEQARQDSLKDMISHRTETKLGDDKQVVDRSLRRLECGIPELEFESDIEIASSEKLPDEWLERYLNAVCAAVKSIGGGRARGLGKCKLSIKGTPIQHIELPCELEGDVQ